MLRSDQDTGGYIVSLFIIISGWLEEPENLVKKHISIKLCRFLTCSVRRLVARRSPSYSVAAASQCYAAR